MIYFSFSHKTKTISCAKNLNYEAKNKKAQTSSNEVSPTEEENKYKYSMYLNKDNIQLQRIQLFFHESTSKSIFIVLFCKSIYNDFIFMLETLLILSKYTS